MFYAKSEWSDTLELIGCIFLLLISYFIGCELTEYSFWRASNIPDDVRSDYIKHKSQNFQSLGHSLSISMGGLDDDEPCRYFNNSCNTECSSRYG